MEKSERLELCADEFYAMLKKYSEKDPDLVFFLNQFKYWYEKIKSQKITPPCYGYHLDIYFTNPDLSHIAEKYHYAEFGKHELNIAAGRFFAAIRDRPIE